MAKNTIIASIKTMFRAFWNLISGRIITVAFIKRHFAKIALLLFVILGFTANKFSALIEMKRISILESELKTSQSSFIMSSANYYSKVREKTMKQLIDTMELHLNAPEKPPFILNYNEQ